MSNNLAGSRPKSEWSISKTRLIISLIISVVLIAMSVWFFTRDKPNVALSSFLAAFAFIILLVGALGYEAKDQVHAIGWSASGSVAILLAMLFGVPYAHNKTVLPESDEPWVAVSKYTLEPVEVKLNGKPIGGGDVFDQKRQLYHEIDHHGEVVVYLSSPIDRSSAIGQLTLDLAELQNGIQFDELEEFELSFQRDNDDVFFNPEPANVRLTDGTWLRFTLKAVDSSAREVSPENAFQSFQVEVSAMKSGNTILKPTWFTVGSQMQQEGTENFRSFRESEDALKSSTWSSFVFKVGSQIVVVRPIARPEPYRGVFKIYEGVVVAAQSKPFESEWFGYPN